MKTVTIILPAYNEEESMPKLIQCMSQVCEQNPGYDWKFLLVNDGSTDNTLQLMHKLHQSDNRFSYIDLSRNFGKEAAMMAGFDHAKGDAVIVMDADMQHPISVIPQMLKYWEEGYDDVYALRRSSKEGFLKKSTSKLYYRLLQRLTKVQIQVDTGDFRLLDRICVDAITQMRESERNTKAIYSWIGFKKKAVLYDQLERSAGVSKWPFRDLLTLALTGLTSYTTAPLRLATLLGLSLSALAFLYAVYIIIKTICFGEPVVGFPTLIVAILLTGGTQLLALGIIGEYLARVFNETKSRPGYFIKSINGETVGK